MVLLPRSWAKAPFTSHAQKLPPGVQPALLKGKLGSAAWQYYVHQVAMALLTPEDGESDALVYSAFAQYSKMWYIGLPTFSKNQVHRCVQLVFIQDVPIFSCIR